MKNFLKSQSAGYVCSLLGVLLAALVLWPFYPQVRGITAATAQLIVVLLVAIRWGTGPALAASLLGAAYINFYFVPPVFTLSFPLPQGDDLVGACAYLITSILVGQLSARAQKRASQVQELYDQLQAAFEKASQLEGIRRIERLKSALLDAVAHDFRTPLTSIKAAATDLTDSDENDSSHSVRRERRLLGIIVQQADRMNRFIEGMLEIAKVEGGLSARQTEKSTLEDVTSVAAARAGDTLNRHRLVIEFEDEIAGREVPKAISQVLFLLLENAARYAPQGTAVHLQIADRDGSELVFMLDDQGPGVPQELREKIFEKFFRAERADSSASGVSGMGLGLAIARGIVEALGGTIWVEDHAGSGPGARFIFTVPASAATCALFPSQVPA